MGKPQFRFRKFFACDLLTPQGVSGRNFVRGGICTLRSITLCMYVCMYVCMYEIRDRQDPVKGSGWVLFPSTMAEQPIQQMVVGHLCFQEHAEQ